MWKRLLVIAILALSSSAAAGGEPGQFPSKAIRLVDGFAPGGGTDYVARLIAPKLAERLGQPVIVENRSGAGGNLAAASIARAEPDGHNLMLGASTPLASSPSLYKEQGYNLLDDLSYVSTVTTATFVLVATPSIQARSVPELLTLARSRGQPVRYASAGVGGASHLAAELLRSLTGTELMHIPYKGGSFSITAVMTGEADILFTSVAAATPMIEAKRLKLLAVTSTRRLGRFPEVPTVAESGVQGFNVTTVYGILGPARIPPQIAKRLNSEIRNVLQMEDVKAKFAAQALEASASSPDEYKSIMKAEMAQWARVIKEARITVN